jgi:hypothetical protein
MNRTAAVLSAFLVLSLVGAAALSVQPAHAMVLPTPPWDDYWPWQMTISYPQASSYNAKMSAVHGSSAAVASTSPLQTTFWANATDTFTCTMTIQYPAPASGLLSVSVNSYSKFKDFVIPFANETTITLSFTVTLEPTPQFPSAAEQAAQVSAQQAGQFQQLHNDNMLTQNIMNSDLNTFGTVILAVAVAVCILGWVAYQQHRDVRELRGLQGVEKEGTS